MASVPSSLRAKSALVALFAVLMIPLWTSSLRGLTHVLTCQETTDTDFTIEVASDGTAAVLSSLSFDRETAERELCEGLVLDVGIAQGSPGAADLKITITNNSEFDWQGSMKVELDDVSFPIPVGDVASGRSETETVELNLDDGRSYAISGTLLVGP